MIAYREATMPTILPAEPGLDTEPDPNLIDLWLSDLRMREKEPTTIKQYEATARRAERELPHGLAFAAAEELKAWIWQPDFAASTKHNYRAALASFFAWACNPIDPWLSWDPMRLLPTVKVRQGLARPITGEIVADILARAAEPYRLWYLLAAGAGFRDIEISRLDRQHVTEETIWTCGKGGREKFIPTHPAIWAAIAPLPAGPIARMARSGRRADRTNVEQRGNNHLHLKLGYADVTMHRLRHYFGTTVHRVSGRDLRVAQDALRHASPVQTAGYVATLEPALVDAVHAVPLYA